MLYSDKMVNPTDAKGKMQQNFLSNSKYFYV